MDNPNINQVIQVGCPRNLGVLLQELGRAGRKPGSVAKGLLLFNEVVDDKRLGLWLKSALESKEANASADRVKSERFFIHMFKRGGLFTLFTMRNAWQNQRRIQDFLKGGVRIRSGYRGWR